MPNENTNKKRHNFVKIDLGEAGVKEKAKPAVIAGEATTKKTGAVSTLSKEEKKIKSELQEIYKNDDGTMPNMSDFKKRKKRSLFSAFIFLLFSCVFLAVVAWAGFFIFQPQARFAEQDIELRVEGPEKLAVGGEIKYKINYDNNQNVPLAKAALQVRYPEGFVFTSASTEPINGGKNEWELGSLGKNSGGVLEITGNLYGNLGEKQSLRVFFNYTPANFSSEFQKVASLSTDLEALPIEMNVISPEDTTPGVDKEFIMELVIPAELDKTNLALLFEPEGGFSKKESSLASVSDNQYLWNLTSFTDTNSKITIKGSFSPENGQEEIKVLFKIVGWKDNARQAVPYIFYSQEEKIKILQTDLAARLTVNGSVSEITVEPSEELSTGIILKNSGSRPLKNVQARLIYETPSYNNQSLLNWRELDDVEDGEVTGEQVNAQTRRGYIVWDKGQIRDLTQLDPGEELKIDLSIPLKDNSTTDLKQFSSYFISSVVEIKYEDEGQQKMIGSNQIKMTANSDLGLAVKDKVSVSGQNSETHAVNWILGNSFHELKNIKASVEVYGDVLWQEDKLVFSDGTTAEWDAKNKKLTWNIPSMPTSIKNLALQFVVELKSKNPSQTNLTSKISLEAMDAITGKTITKVVDGIAL